MAAFIQKAHGCIFFYDAIEAQEAQLAISDRGSPHMEMGREQKKMHLGTPHFHKVFVTIWGLTCTPYSEGVAEL